MRTILCFIFLFLLSNMVPAQSLAQSNSTPAVQSGSSANSNVPSKLKTKHTQLAVNQLRDFLSDNLDYSEISRSLNIEGKALVEIKLSNSGHILTTKIIESPNTQLNTIIVDAMKKFTTINTRNKPYSGAHRIQIPILFSLR